MWGYVLLSPKMVKRRSSSLEEVTDSHTSYLFLMSNSHSPGPAGLECAETLRREGFKGNVILASQENVLPYDRPKLSKVCACVCRCMVCVCVREREGERRERAREMEGEREGVRREGRGDIV